MKEIDRTVETDEYKQKRFDSEFEVECIIMQRSCVFCMIFICILYDFYDNCYTFSA